MGSTRQVHAHSFLVSLITQNHLTANAWSAKVLFVTWKGMGSQVSTNRNIGMRSMARLNLRLEQTKHPICHRKKESHSDLQIFRVSRKDKMSKAKRSKNRNKQESPGPEIQNLPIDTHKLTWPLCLNSFPTSFLSYGEIISWRPISWIRVCGNSVYKDSDPQLED